MRIASLLPSATEIVCALGLRESLVGITHECDYPPGLDRVPRLTASLLDPALSSREIDTLVSESLRSDAHTIYALDAALLRSLEPDVVLTQSLCEVCAVPAAAVEEAVCTMPKGARVVSLDPHDLDGIFDSIAETARLLQVTSAGRPLVDRLRTRLDTLRAPVDARKPTMLAAEWLDPVYCGGHWVPDMIEWAGGRDLFGRPGQPSRPLPFDEIRQADPEVIVLMPCGYDAAEIAARYSELVGNPDWRLLRAVRDCRVYSVDANAYFSRPGPRVIEGIEILAAILQPGADTASRREDVLRLGQDGCFHPL